MVQVKRERRQRKERRFVPQSAWNPWIPTALGWIAMGALGAGTYSKFFARNEWEYASHLLAGGALLFGVTIWLGTSGDTLLRVGDGGVAEEGPTTKRIPWSQVESVRWNEGKRGIEVRGRDEGQASTLIVARAKTHPKAAAWILQEAERRIPKLVELSQAAREELTATKDADGETLILEPLQVVGKKCAKSRRAITYPQDARVCPHCERIYHRKDVPEECTCGCSMKEFAGDAGADETDTDAEEVA